MKEIIVVVIIIVSFCLGAANGYESGKKDQKKIDMIQRSKDWPEEVKIIKEIICPK